MCQSLVTRMVVLRFAWVFEAYQCFAYAIVSELIQAVSGEFDLERGPVSAGYAVRLTGVAQVTRHIYLQLMLRRKDCSHQPHPAVTCFQALAALTSLVTSQDFGANLNPFGFGANLNPFGFLKAPFL